MVARRLIPLDDHRQPQFPGGYLDGRDQLVVDHQLVHGVRDEHVELEVQRAVPEAHEQGHWSEINWQALENLGIAWVDIAHEPDTLLMEQISDTDTLDREKLQKAKAKESYFYALNSIKEVAEKITNQKKVGVRKALRVIQNMVDLVMEDESIVLGLSTIRDYDDYTFTHSINVAVLSMRHRNLFNEDAREPSPYDATAPLGAFIPNDYPLESRAIWGEIRAHF